ncbi:MAG: SPOR domain-containing protein [Bacteroidota bacterium]|nr:SPOR domain-containing protein [Kiloniellaceae bacterium]
MLTISACRALRRAAGGAAAAGSVLLAACTIEVGPPPESDPPLVPEAAKAPPAPAQPTEPQAWSRDLDFDSVPVAADRERLAQGLVAAGVEPSYSGERLTFESAFNPEKPPSEAELARQRALQRASEAGLPPPPAVAPPPVEQVEAQSLDATGSGEAAPAPKRESRLPPPPKLPPLPARAEEGEAPAEAAAEAAPEPQVSQPVREPEPWSSRNSRLPAPPKLPPVEPAVTQTAAAAPAEPAADAPISEAPEAAEAAAFVAETWDPPSGTILVQVSAVPDGNRVTEEWQRLRTRYPQVLTPLRLVVEQAKLGERGVFYRVQAGAFGTQEGAAAACDSLISQGQACFVVVR